MAQVKDIAGSAIMGGLVRAEHSASEMTLTQLSAGASRLLATGLLEHPYNMAAGFSQSK